MAKKKSVMRQKIESYIDNGVKLKSIDYQKGRALAWKKVSALLNPDLPSDQKETILDFVRFKFTHFLDPKDLKNCGITMNTKERITREVYEAKIMYDKLMGILHSKMTEIDYHLKEIKELIDILEEKRNELEELED